MYDQSAIMAIVMITIVIIAIISEIVEQAQYQKSIYRKQTQNEYIKVKFDKGLHQEYLIYKKLKYLDGKFLFNCYLNKRTGNTTEVDTILIHQKGIFVFESKNYSGWIFGNDQDRNWTQTLKAGGGKSQKNHFYNPVKQNETHINTLRSITRENIPIYSIIVFSNKCELKKVTVRSTNTYVIKINELPFLVNRIINQNRYQISETKVNQIYNKLYPYTQVPEETKQKHIERIRARRGWATRR